MKEAREGAPAGGFRDRPKGLALDKFANAKTKVYDKKAMVEKKRIMKAKQYGKVKKLMGRMKEAGELPSTIQIAQEVAERDANDILRANRSAQGAGPSSEPPKKTPSARGKGQGKPEGRPEKKRGRPENASAEQALPAEGKASGPPEKKRKFNALQKLHEEAKVKKNEEAKQRQEAKKRAEEQKAQQEAYHHQRTKQKQLHHKVTKKGQPIMGARISNLLDKIQKGI